MGRISRSPSLMYCTSDSMALLFGLGLEEEVLDRVQDDIVGRVW